jgi:hypothetical protein
LHEVRGRGGTNQEKPLGEDALMLRQVGGDCLDY